MVQVPIKNYGYTNARVKSMKGRLIDPSTMDSLISARTQTEFLGILENTAYSKDVIEAIMHGMYPTVIERAFNNNIAREFKDIRTSIIGRPQELIDIVLSRWDLFNIKTVLRGKKALTSEQEIVRNLIPAGSIDLISLEEISKQPDLKAAIDSMVVLGAGWFVKYGMLASEAYSEYQKDKNMSVIELALDKGHYGKIYEFLGKASDINDKMVLKITDMEVDILDLMTIFRICTMDLPKDKKENLIIEGGTLKTKKKALLKCQKVEEVIAQVPSVSGLKKPLQRGLEKYAEKGETAFYDEMEKELVKTALKMEISPLTIGVIISYMWRKYTEVYNLRIAYRGLSVGLIESQIRKELLTFEEQTTGS